MPKPKADKEKVLELLRDGWEMGWSGGGHIWLQRKLMHGGDSWDVRLGTYNALIRAGLIESAPKRKADPFWLSRLRLSRNDGGNAR